MLNALIIIFREGFEAFLTVAIIFAYLRKTGRDSLRPGVYVGIAVSVITSFWLGYLMQSVESSLWEGVLGIVAAVLVASFVIHVWRTASHMKKDMESRLEAASSHSSKPLALLAVFAFTVFMITREGMEAALMLIQVREQHELLLGCILGVVAAASMSWAWAHFGHRVNVRRFFQVTGMFLLLFTAQILFFSIHEFSEAGMFGSHSEAIHQATEPFSPVGYYGKWFSIALVVLCGLWLFAVSMRDRMARSRLELKPH